MSKKLNIFVVLTVLLVVLAGIANAKEPVVRKNLKFSEYFTKGLTDENNSFGELFLGWGKGKLKGDIQLGLDTKNDVLNLENDYYIDAKDASYNSEFETLQIFNFEIVNNWGIYARFVYLPFDAKGDIKLVEPGLLASVDAKNRRLTVTSVDLGILRKLYASNKLGLYLGVGYKSAQVGVTEDNLFGTTDNKKTYDEIAGMVRLQVYPTKMMVIKGVYSYGFSTGKKSKSQTIDLSVSYGRTVFIRAGYIYGTVKAEDGNIDFNYSLPYAGIGVYFR